MSHGTLCLILALATLSTAAGLAAPAPAAARTEQQAANFIQLHGARTMAASDDLSLKPMAHYPGVRRSATAVAGHVDFHAYSYTRPGDFNLVVSLGQKTPDEGADVPQADLFLVQLTLDLDRYRTLFESDETVEIPEWEGIAYLFRATASGTRDSRIVKFTWRAVDGGRETRRGALELTCREGLVAQAHLTKWACKRLFNRWTVVLDDTLELQAPDRIGLGLRDDDEIGRLTTLGAIRQALLSQNSAGYRQALEMEAGRVAAR